MRLAANGTPVAVKRRAVETVNKVKIRPVIKTGSYPQKQTVTIFVGVQTSNLIKFYLH
jgi:hypothetical protein